MSEPRIKQKFNVVPIATSDNWTYVPVTETQQETDPKRGLPAFYIRKSDLQMMTLRVWDSDGNEIGRLGYYGGYGEGGQRWYSGFAGGSSLSAADLKQRAVGNTGCADIYVEHNDGEVFGPICPTDHVGVELEEEAP